VSERRPRMVDPRQPRFGQFLTGLTALVAFVFQVPALFIALTIVLGLGVLSPTTNLWAYGYRAFKAAARLGPPKELEDAAPPRFAMIMGTAMFALASVAYFVASAETLAWVLDGIVIVLGFLGAAGFCVGCEIYLAGRRLQARRTVRAEA
jgi:hypothetical protein